MSYTLEQKREAFNQRKLWWRFPKSTSEMMREWSLMNDDYEGGIHSDAMFERASAEYRIESTPPRVLSELEGELFREFVSLIVELDTEAVRMLVGDAPFDRAHAVLRKAEGQL